MKEAGLAEQKDELNCDAFAPGSSANPTGALKLNGCQSYLKLGQKSQAYKTHINHRHRPLKEGGNHLSKAAPFIPEPLEGEKFSVARER